MASASRSWPVTCNAHAYASSTNIDCRRSQFSSPTRREGLGRLPMVGIEHREFEIDVDPLDFGTAALRCAPGRTGPARPLVTMQRGQVVAVLDDVRPAAAAGRRPLLEVTQRRHRLSAGRRLDLRAALEQRHVGRVAARARPVLPRGARSSPRSSRRARRSSTATKPTSPATRHRCSAQVQDSPVPWAGRRAVPPHRTAGRTKPGPASGRPSAKSRLGGPRDNGRVPPVHPL